MAADILIFNPVTGERRKTSYKALEKITGLSSLYLATLKYKRFKVANLNCYIVSSKTPIKELEELMRKEVIEDEYWKDIPKSKYQVSNYGRYRSSHKSDEWRLMVPPTYRTGGTPKISLTIDGKRNRYLLHHFVFEAFMEKPDGEGWIRCHRDNNKYNNRVQNLFWTTRKKCGKLTAPASKSKPVLRINMETGEEDYYESMADAGRDNFCSRWTIATAIRENRPAVGYRWKLYNIEED